MLTERREANPFDAVKASDFTDDEILDQWVDISGDYGLEHLIKPTMVMPMLLLGGKGSGKTHLMRYISAPVRSAHHGGDLRLAIETDGYLGVYVRGGGLNTPKFSGKGQTDEAWSSIFNMYFEMWLVVSLIRNALCVFKDTTPQQDAAFGLEASKLFNAEMTAASVQDILNRVEESIRHIDYVVDNASLTREIAGIEVTFSPGRLMYGIPEVLKKIYPAFKHVLFVYLIDEIENLTIDQQRFVNSLVRYRTGNVSIKIGARLYGIRTYETMGGGEPIKRDAEYERVELDGFLRDHEHVYSDFCKRLTLRRLEYFNMRGSRVTEENIDQCFSEVETHRYSQMTTKKLVESSDRQQRDRPYHVRLRKLLVKGGFEESLAHALVDATRVNEYPLLEKLALFFLYRNWKNDPKALADTAARAGQLARSLGCGESGRENELAGILNYFRSDLMAQLFRDCHRVSPYAGFRSLIHLSQGIPRNLLSIMRHIYRRSLFAGEKPFAGGTISVEAQSLGVKDSAAWFWEDAQPESHSQRVRESIELLATLFRTLRYSERPPECDCATFSVRISELTCETLSVIETAENWSYLIRIRDGSSDKNDQSVNAKFQLGPMLAPKWGVSEHRRGTTELSAELANAIFDSSCREALTRVFQKRVSRFQGESFIKLASGDQQQLFS